LFPTSPDLEPVPLSFKKVLHSPFEPIEHVFFITRGVASLVSEPETGGIVEFATVGPEGMVGFPVLDSLDHAQMQNQTHARQQTAAPFSQFRYTSSDEAALGLLPLDPRPKQAILLPNTRSDWL
jgi:hypothetical protein